MSENKDSSSTTEADSVENDRKSNRGARWLRRYVCVHAVIVAFACMGALLETRFHVRGFFYGAVFFVVNWTAIYFLIGPVVSIAIVLVAIRRDREYAYLAFVDILLSLLHFVALNVLVTS